MISTLLDTDLYKFTMSQFARRYYPHVRVKMSLMSRRRVDIFEHVDPAELQEELDKLVTLPVKLDTDQQAYLVSLGLDRGYVDDLTTRWLPKATVTQMRGLGASSPVSVEGPWWVAMLWETLVMSTVSELYYRGRINMPAMHDRLHRKGRILAEADLDVVDFGTRRRHSGRWHRDVVMNMRDLLKGTSNVALAREFDLPCVGTMAHEVFMVPAALMCDAPRALRGVPQAVLEQWRAMYGSKFGIALTDTFGSRTFARDLTSDQLHLWDGFRQDSGDPLAWASMMLSLYDRNLPKSRRFVFSDGLTIPKMLLIDHEYGKKVNCQFGWGTNLTCDLGREWPVQPLDVIVKVVEADGRPTVKLSDDPAKSLGPARGQVKYRGVFA